MKNSVLLLLLSLCLNLSLIAQQSLSQKITNITWTLQSDEMSGMGLIKVCLLELLLFWMQQGNGNAPIRSTA